MEFRLLGPLRVTVPGREVIIGSAKHRILLAALLLHANRTVDTERLAGWLWDADQPVNPRATIHIYVRRLRQALGDERGGLIRTRPDGYCIEVEPDRLDLTAFETLLERAAAALDPAAERDLLDKALELWHGTPLLDVVPAEKASVQVAGPLDVQARPWSDRGRRPYPSSPMTTR